MEHEIIHLLFSLWGYDDIELQKKDYALYGPHGRLFNCMLNTYFGHTEYSHNLSFKGLDSDNYISKYEEPVKYGFSYWENSCYMDSVLTLLLENQCNFWRRTIFDWNEHKPSANPELAETLKDELNRDYSKLGDKTLECKNFRKLLAVHDPLMKEGSTWVMYEVSAFYANLAELYPDLKIDIPYRMVRPSLSAVESMRYKSEYLFSVEEYINPDRRGEDYKEILWNECKSPILVFTNQGTRRIKNFDRREGDKKRVLKPRILGKYKLVGVVTLKGEVTESGGGGHYVSYFVAKDGKWYSYDDLSPKIRLVGDGYVDDLPRPGIWQEKNNRMPALYFYALDEHGIDKRKTENLTFERMNREDKGTIFKITVENPDVDEQIVNFADDLEGAMTVNGKTLFLRLSSIEKGDKMEEFLISL